MRRAGRPGGPSDQVRVLRSQGPLGVRVLRSQGPSESGSPRSQGPLGVRVPSGSGCPRGQGLSRLGLGFRAHPRAPLGRCSGERTGPGRVRGERGDARGSCPGSPRGRPLFLPWPEPPRCGSRSRSAGPGRADVTREAAAEGPPTVSASRGRVSGRACQCPRPAPGSPGCTAEAEGAKSLRKCHGAGFCPSSGPAPLSTCSLYSRRPFGGRCPVRSGPVRFGSVCGRRGRDRPRPPSSLSAAGAGVPVSGALVLQRSGPGATLSRGALAGVRHKHADAGDEGRNELTLK